MVRQLSRNSVLAARSSPCTMTCCGGPNSAVRALRGISKPGRATYRSGHTRARRQVSKVAGVPRSIESGVTHARFAELFVEVATFAQRERVGRALQPILIPAPWRWRANPHRCLHPARHPELAGRYRWKFCRTSTPSVNVPSRFVNVNAALIVPVELS